MVFGQDSDRCNPEEGVVHIQVDLEGALAPEGSHGVAETGHIQQVDDFQAEVRSGNVGV